MKQEPQCECRAVRIVNNLREISLGIFKLHARIFAADMQGKRALSAQLRMLAVPYRVGMGIAALQLFNPISWMMKRSVRK